MRTKPLNDVIMFCLDNAPSAPVNVRVSLYLGLAEICGDPQEAVSFKAMARDLADVEARCRQLTFQLSQ